MTRPPSFLSCTVKKPSGNSEDCGAMHSVSFSENSRRHTHYSPEQGLQPVASEPHLTVLADCKVNVIVILVLGPNKCRLYELKSCVLILTQL